MMDGNMSYLLQPGLHLVLVLCHLLGRGLDAMGMSSYAP